MTDDYEYFFKKRADRVYLSKSLENKSFRKNDEGEIEEITRPFRIVGSTGTCVMPNTVNRNQCGQLNQTVTQTIVKISIF